MALFNINQGFNLNQGGGIFGAALKPVAKSKRGGRGKAVIQEYKFDFGDKKTADIVEEEDNEDDSDSLPVTLSDHFVTLFNKPELSDIQFKVGDNNPLIYAHKLILAAHSSSFQAMCYPVKWNDDNDTKTNSSNNTNNNDLVVTIKDCDYNIFLSFIQCIYTDNIDTIDSNNISELIKLGRKYQIAKVNLLCSEYMESDLTISNACEMFELACSLLNDQLFGIEFIEENIEDIFNTEGWLNLSKSRLKVLLNHNKLACDEHQLFDALLKWGKNQLTKTGKSETDKAALKALLSDCLSLIRFPLMSLEEIASTVAPSELLDQNDLLKLFQYLSINDNTARQYFQIPFNTEPREGASMIKDSKIVNKNHKKSILKLFDGKKQKFELLWRGSRDTFSGTAFHEKCDNKGATFTVVKSNTGHIFGGYNPESWSQSGTYGTTPGCWLFNIAGAGGDTNKPPIKLIPSSTANTVYNAAGYGPTWGGGHDLHISSNMKSNSNYSNPNTYLTVAPGFTGTFTNATLAGSYNFIVDEIETYKVKPKPNVK